MPRLKKVKSLYKVPAKSRAKARHSRANWLQRKGYSKSRSYGGK